MTFLYSPVGQRLLGRSKFLTGSEIRPRRGAKATTRSTPRLSARMTSVRELVESEGEVSVALVHQRLGIESAEARVMLNRLVDRGFISSRLDESGPRKARVYAALEKESV